MYQYHDSTPCPQPAPTRHGHWRGISMYINGVQETIPGFCSWRIFHKPGRLVKPDVKHSNIVPVTILRACLYCLLSLFVYTDALGRFEERVLYPEQWCVHPSECARCAPPAAPLQRPSMSHTCYQLKKPIYAERSAQKGGWCWANLSGRREVILRLGTSSCPKRPTRSRQDSIS